jgi:hypothetical protein
VKLEDLDNGGLDGAAVLDEVLAFLRSYVAFGTYAAVAVTLWVAHTHLADRFDSTPRLALESPEKQCGKTRVLELLVLLCAGAELLSDASAAYLFRRIDAGKITILLDEADVIWKRGKSDDSAEALRSVVNAGHRKGATVGRVVMNGKTGTLVNFQVYAPAALAAIGTLPDTILDRAVVIHMRRRAPDERLRDYRARIAGGEGKALHDRLADWAAQVAGGIGEDWPELPAGVTDRPADVWEPLITIADLAGGHWPQRAREACLALVKSAREDTETVGTRLLADLRGIFGDTPAMPTEAILGKLRATAEAPWGDWYGRPLSDRDLAKLLRPYGIKSLKVWVDGRSVRGYRREDFWDAWCSYLPPEEPAPGKWKERKVWKAADQAPSGPSGPSAYPGQEGTAAEGEAPQADAWVCVRCRQPCPPPCEEDDWPLCGECVEFAS